MYPSKPAPSGTSAGDASRRRGAGAGASSAVDRERIRALVGIAATNESSISLDELLDLLPPKLFDSREALAHFIATDDGLSRQLAAVDGEVTFRGRESLAERRLVQRGITEGRLAEAARFLHELGRICPWIELAGISGSTAYGGAKPADDIDFFLVTQEHRLWATLLLAFLCARGVRFRSAEAPVYCFNRTLERPACERAFLERRDPLFAREALNLRVLHGNGAYRDLLASAPWMAESFPRLYTARLAATAEGAWPVRRSAGPEGRLLNAAALLVLGPYLWMAGLARNVRLRRAGREKECFRTVVRSDFCATESVLYDELREEYRRAFA